MGIGLEGTEVKVVEARMSLGIKGKDGSLGVLEVVGWWQLG